jgi:hypothetical protein
MEPDADADADADPEACDDNFSERSGSPVDPKEARAVAYEVQDMITFIRQVAEREMASFENGAVMEDNYALLVKQDGQIVAVKFGTDEATEGADAILSSLADKFKIILLRRNCYCKGANRQITLDVESIVGSFQSLLKYENNSNDLPPRPPELRCMHAPSRNKWFKAPGPASPATSESPIAWFSDC